MEKYIEAIKEWHGGQYDKLGQPYWLHPLRVMKIVQEIMPGATREVLAIALFHDVIEDVKDGFNKLWEFLADEDRQFRLNVVGTVNEFLTKPAKESYVSYVWKIFSSENTAAKIVKKADIIDHLTLLPKIKNLKERERLAKKYSQVIGMIDS